jgi:O-antigen/teichoic acid export membrane protein
MSLRRKVLGNSLYQLAGKALTTITSLVLVAFITRSLGVGDYGNYITVLAYTQFFGIFADLGVNLYLIKQLAAKPEGDEETESMYGLRIVTTLGILGIGMLGSFIAPYSHEVRTAIFLGMIAVGAQTVNSLGVSILQARLHMLPAAAGEVVGRLVTLGGSVIAIKMGGGLYGVVMAVVLGSLVNVVVTFAYSGKYLPSRFRWNPAMWKKILRASLPISLTAILSFLYFKSDTVLLSILPLHGGKVNAVEVGIYGAAYKVLEMLLLVPAIFVGNIFPIISSFWANKDDRLYDTLQQAFDLMATFGAFVTMVVAVLAKPIMLFIAGPQFVVAALPLQILAVTIFVTYFTSIYTYTALALNEQRRLALVYLTATVFNIVANVIFIPQYSYIAAAIVTFLTEIIVIVGAYLICNKVLHIKMRLGKLLTLIPISLITAGVLYWARTFHVLIAALVGLIIYGVLVAVCRVVQPRELASMMKRSNS